MDVSAAVAVETEAAGGEEVSVVEVPVVAGSVAGGTLHRDHLDRPRVSTS